MEQVADDLDTLLRFERAAAINEYAAWLRQLGRLSGKPTLQCCERGDVGGVLEPGDVGMAADGSRGRAGRIEEHGVERPGLPLRGIGGDGFRAELEPGKVLPKSFES